MLAELKKSVYADFPAVWSVIAMFLGFGIVENLIMTVARTIVAESYTSKRTIELWSPSFPYLIICKKPLKWKKKKNIRKKTRFELDYSLDP